MILSNFVIKKHKQEWTSWRVGEEFGYKGVTFTDGIKHMTMSILRKWSEKCGGKGDHYIYLARIKETSIYIST